MTYVITNSSGQGLAQAAYQMGVFRCRGHRAPPLVMDFGAIPDGKTKIMQFELADQACTDISRIVVNEVAACKLDTDGAMPLSA